MLTALRSLLARRRHAALAARITPDWATARAREGAAFLDDADPGWASRVDPDTLVLGDGQACVLGQLHGDYRRGLFRSRVLDGSSAFSRFVSPVDLGFQASGAAGDELERLDYAYLTRAWRAEVLSRRGRRATPEAAQHGGSVPA